MKIWVDANLSLTLAPWLIKEFGLDAVALRDLSLQDASDREILNAARNAQAVIMTKNQEFLHLATLDLVFCSMLPPQILWLSFGDEVTHRNLPKLLLATLPHALRQLRQGGLTAEISNAPLPISLKGHNHSGSHHQLPRLHLQKDQKSWVKVPR